MKKVIINAHQHVYLHAMMRVFLEQFAKMFYKITANENVVLATELLDVQGVQKNTIQFVKIGTWGNGKFVEPTLQLKAMLAAKAQQSPDLYEIEEGFVKAKGVKLPDSVLPKGIERVIKEVVVEKAHTAESVLDFLQAQSVEDLEPFAKLIAKRKKEKAAQEKAAQELATTNAATNESETPPTPETPTIQTV
jgi:hypothetical protein